MADFRVAYPEYEETSKLDELRASDHDHNEIRDAVAEVARHPVGGDDWYAAVAQANLANSDHIAEEEREGLADFRRLAGLRQRHTLAVAFAAYEARNVTGVTPVDKDPAEYVGQAEAGTGQTGVAVSSSAKTTVRITVR